MWYDAKGRYDVASLTAIIVSNQAGEYVLWVPHEAANSRRAPPRAYLIPCQAKSGSDSAWLSKRYRNGCDLKRELGIAPGCATNFLNINKKFTR